MEKQVFVFCLLVLGAVAVCSAARSYDDDGPLTRNIPRFDPSKLKPCIYEGTFFCKCGDASYGCVTRGSCLDYCGFKDDGDDSTSD